MGFLAFSCIRYGIRIIRTIFDAFALCVCLVVLVIYAFVRPFQVHSEREGEGRDIVSNNLYHGLDSEWESDGEDIVSNNYHITLNFHFKIISPIWVLVDLDSTFVCRVVVASAWGNMETTMNI